MTVVGARPQFIKAAPVSRALQEAGITEVFVHTGQHYDANLSDIFFKELELPTPHYHLAIGSGHHGAQTAHMLTAIESVCIAEKPDVVLVYGDTNSTLAGALAAAKLSIPIAHVEAGLRSFNRHMPEEINRILTDRISSFLFTPTQIATEHLQREGIAPDIIHCVGDVMYDVSRYFGAKAEATSTLLSALQLKAGSYLLATIHRAENTDDPTRLTAIFNALIAQSATHPVVMPLHPRTKKYLLELGLYDQVAQSLGLIEPVGFLDMLQLEKNARLIVTDSGGVQKEAYFYQVPCVTLRDETEWVELVESGWNRLAPPHSAQAVQTSINTALQSPLPVDRGVTLYGDGHSAKKIAQILKGG